MDNPSHSGIPQLLPGDNALGILGKDGKRTYVAVVDDHCRVKGCFEPVRFVLVENMDDILVSVALCASHGKSRLEGELAAVGLSGVEVEIFKSTPTLPV